MSAPADVDLSPYAAFVIAAGAFFGPHAAQYVSAYALVLIGWFCGLMFGLWRRSPEARMPVWAYALFTLTAAIGVTVPAAELLQPYTPLPASALLFPVSAAIPAVPDKWGAIVAWAAQVLKTARGSRP